MSERFFSDPFIFLAIYLNRRLAIYWRLLLSFRLLTQLATANGQRLRLLPRALVSAEEGAPNRGLLRPLVLLFLAGLVHFLAVSQTVAIGLELDRLPALLALLRGVHAVLVEVHDGATLAAQRPALQEEHTWNFAPVTKRHFDRAEFVDYSAPGNECAEIYFVENTPK